MGSILSETKTRVSVKTDTSSIDECISNIDSSIFAPVIKILQEKKKIIENDIPPELADRVATRARSYQEDIIYMNGTVDTTQMVSTIFTEPTGQNSVDVGPTALSAQGFPYPVVIEYGSEKYNGKPFVQPSINRIQGDLQELGLEVSIEKLGV